MTELPRLELTEDPKKNNDYIIFRNHIKNKNVKTLHKSRFKKRVNNKTKKKRKNKKSGFLGLF
jgi:hypothetical protein